MKTRIGNIAPLPEESRTGLDQGLNDGVTGPELAPRLNGLPEAPKVLAAQQLVNLRRESRKALRGEMERDQWEVEATEMYAAARITDIEKKGHDRAFLKSCETDVDQDERDENDEIRRENEKKIRVNPTESEQIRVNPSKTPFFEKKGGGFWFLWKFGYEMRSAESRVGALSGRGDGKQQDAWDR